jgi:hypothetical protein
VANLVLSLWHELLSSSGPKIILGERPSPKRKERMTGQYYSHLNPKCDSGVFEEKGGCGVFAREPIKKGELICLWGGRIVSADELDPNMQFFTQRILQIEGRSGWSPCAISWQEKN